MLPHGIQSVEDLPWDLARAIEHANKVLNWQKNLSSDEMPPSWMWAHDSELEQWFDEVRIKRDEKYGDGGGDYDDREDTNMMGNELAAAKKKG